MDNNEKLKKLIVSTGLTQKDALAILNHGQARPVALSTWKAYLAGQESARRRTCPDNILHHAEKVLARYINEL